MVLYNSVLTGYINRETKLSSLAVPRASDLPSLHGLRDGGERERGCGRPITNGTAHGTNPSAAAESALPEGV